MNTPSVARKVRVAHLVSHPIQYFAPLYHALAQNPEIDLTVFFYSGKSLGEHFDKGFGRVIRWDVPLVDGYRFHLSPAARKRYPSETFDWRLDLSIIRRLISDRYDVIWLHGHMAINAWMAMFFGCLTGTPVLLRDDATHLTPRFLLKRIIKKLVLPFFYRNIIGLYVGRSNRDFFEYYGTKQLYPFYYGLDNNHLRSLHRDLKDRRADLRSALNIGDGELVILFCGKLIKKKQPLLLLEAFARVRKAAKCSLLFVGDGELRSQLESRIQTDAIPDVHFAGFLNQSELPSAYAAADLLVLPSAYDEPWGMVINEAMNFALPIIVSDRVGCARDLVMEGVNGMVFESGNLDALIMCIRKMLDSAELRTTYGKNSLKVISGYTLEESTRQVAHALSSETRLVEETSTAARTVDV